MEFPNDAAIIADWVKGKTVHTEKLVEQLRGWADFLDDHPKLSFAEVITRAVKALEAHGPIDRSCEGSDECLAAETVDLMALLLLAVEGLQRITEEQPEVAHGVNADCMYCNSKGIAREALARLEGSGDGSVPN